MNKSSTTNPLKRAATLLLLMLLSAANALAQTRWQGNGTEQSPYLINSTAQLEALADSVNSGTSYEGQFFLLNADLTYDTATQNNHTAIGTWDNKFRGTFDGNNHTISGIRISSNNYYQGLFGCCQNSAVKNLILTDAQISGQNYVGGIVGISYSGASVENCLVANNVTVSGSMFVGGIVGISYGGASVENCLVANNVTVNGSSCVGGIVGSFDYFSSIGNCQVANNVTVSGSEYVGGIVGYNNHSSVEGCQVANNVTISGGTKYGTIVGENRNFTLRRNYYHGCTVNGVVNTTNVGTGYGDITQNNGAVPGYLITFGEYITSDAQTFTTPAYGEMPETTYQVAPSSDTITLGYEFAGGEVTYYVNGEAIAGNTFTMPAEDVNVTATWEFNIRNATDWDNFCDALQDNDTYNRFIDRTAKLCADIEVTRMAGSSYHDFMGTFDGQGHTLTVAYGSAESPISEEYAAPFRNLENGAVIHNLHVDGHIYTSNKFASGIAGNQYGTVSISNCRSSVIIHSSKSGDGTHGGFVATQHGTLTMSGCIFDGRQLTTNGTTLCSGLVGYHNNGTCTISDCLYAPATDVTLADGETYITNGATFCRNYSGTPANCYYTETLGTAQGKLAHSITPGEGVLMEMAGDATEYDISGITSYGTGIMYGSVLYAGNGDEVGLTFSAPEGFSVVSATYTPEDGMATELTFADGVYSFTMPDANVVIDAVTEYLIHNATEWNNFCDALQDNATYNRFIGDTVRLAADITVTRMAGSSYHDFMGTFDGQGHTLTVAYGSTETPITEEYAAPFRNLENGAYIHSLHVDGHIYTSNKYASGIAGCQYGTVTISNCRSSVIIHSSKSGDGTHGGIVATQHGTLTLSGCVFDGRLLTTNGTTHCSGLVGYHNNGTCTISDCLYAPATDVTLADGETYITDGATFCRNYSGTPENCYYTEALGTAQGKLALTNPAVLPVGEPTATYDVSSLTLYGNGIQFGEVFYYDTERNFLRTIAGYGTGDDGWNLIASPVANDITPTAANGFLTEAYDLFRFNQAADLEWENWKDTVYDNYHFDLASGRGYLYASQTETTLVFTGTPYSGTGEVTLTKTEGVNLSGWNLVGNPFATAKTIGSKPFYRMNDLGSEIIAAESDTIAAMEGIFVVANTDGETVTFAEPTRGSESEGRIIINLCNNAAVIDRAIVRLGEGEMLPKLQIREGNTKVYLPQGGADYAVACVGRDGVHTVSTTEVPVNFKAKEDGTYTISINPEVVEMDYLHLIDNMTGADVDLLVPEPVEGPASYTFTAKTTDYETRFRLVFSNCGDAIGDNEAFAFISNGNIIVNGEGVLQIVDVMGRVILCRDAARHVSTNRMTPGVYVLRLINGNDVRTQKIVIE